MPLSIREMPSKADNDDLLSLFPPPLLMIPKNLHEYSRRRSSNETIATAASSSPPPFRQAQEPPTTPPMARRKTNENFGRASSNSGDDNAALLLQTNNGNTALLLLELKNMQDWMVTCKREEIKDSKRLIQQLQRDLSVKESQLEILEQKQQQTMILMQQKQQTTTTKAAEAPPPPPTEAPTAQVGASAAERSIPMDENKNRNTGASKQRQERVKPGPTFEAPVDKPHHITKREENNADVSTLSLASSSFASTNGTADPTSPSTIISISSESSSNTNTSSVGSSSSSFRKSENQHDIDMPKVNDDTCQQHVQNFQWTRGNGYYYTGTLVRGLPHGRGILRSENNKGTFYKGDWKAGKFHGVGTWAGNDGRRYHGEWKFGLMDGKGIELDSEKGCIRHDGLWKNGRPLSHPRQIRQHRSDNNKTSSAAFSCDASPSLEQYENDPSIAKWVL